MGSHCHVFVHHGGGPGRRFASDAFGRSAYQPLWRCKFSYAWANTSNSNVTTQWQSWEGHDMRFYNRHPEYHPGNRHRRPNTAPPTPHGGSAWRGWRNLFAINFNWRPSMMRITFPHFRRNRNENQALPLAHQRQQVDDTWIPLSDRAQIPSRPSRTLMSERDLVRRDDVISAGLAREGL